MTRLRTLADLFPPDAPVIAFPYITEPGCYDKLTDDEYHRDPVIGGSLSSSGARALLPPSCPAKYAWQREHGRPDTAAFDLGRAAHTRVLGAGAPVVPVHAADWRTKAAKDAAAEIRAAGCTPLLAHQVEQVDAMAAALRAHPVAGPLFARPGRAECSFVGRDLESGVMCRTRVDWLPDVAEDARVIAVDYKTTESAYPPAFAKSMGKYGYHQQGPFYTDVLTWLGLDHGVEPLFVLVAQEKEPPHLVTVATPTADALAWGRVLNRKARDVYRACTESGHWPGYGDSIAELDLPAWLDHSLDAAHADGEFDILTDPIGDR